MFRWIGRRKNPQGDPQPPAAESRSELTGDDVLAVDKELSEYTKNLGRHLAKGAAAAAVVLALAGVLGAIGDGSGPRLSMGPISAASALAAFGILGMLVTALQVAVRRERFQVAEHAASARQRFLILVAGSLVPISLGLGIYVSLQSAGDPRILDPIRVHGPLGGAVLIALFAADAAAVAPIPDDSAVARRARHERRLRSLRESVDLLVAGARPPTVAERIVDVCLLLACGVVTFVCVQLLSPTQDLPLMGRRLVGVALYCAMVVTVVYQAVVASIKENWFGLVEVLVLPVLLAVVLHTSVVVAILAESGPETWAARVAGYLLMVVVGTTVSAGLAMSLTRPRIGTGARQGLLQEFAAGRARAALKGAEKRDPLATAAIDGMAMASVLTSLLFPIGVVLARKARDRLRVVDPQQLRTWDWRLTAIAIGVSWLTPVLLAGGLVAVVMVAPVVS